MIKCLVCNSVNLRLILKVNEKRIYKCKNCLICFFNPLPENLENIYNKRYFESWYLKIYEQRKNYFKIFFNNIKNYIPKTGKLLDIGCGIGIFLDLMKEKNYDVYGIDISEFAINFCKKRGFTVYKSFNELNFSEKTFDLITLLDVIAHLKNPIDYLQKCKKLLKRNGILVIKTPLHSDYIFKIAKILLFTGKSNSILHIPTQIYHFDRNSIFKLSELVGLKIKKIIFLKEFISKKISFLNLWKLLVDKSIIAILENE
ncbi:MAG: class I SAM-dependent methyltransferase [Candidatus Omnitrophica bacterium]|nr:class I SAM-dependent methyltransferase [Candidatus Omnitrophota bacterium]